MILQILLLNHNNLCNLPLRWKEARLRTALHSWVIYFIPISGSFCSIWLQLWNRNSAYNFFGFRFFITALTSLIVKDLAGILQGGGSAVIREQFIFLLQYNLARIRLKKLGEACVANVSAFFSLLLAQLPFCCLIGGYCVCGCFGLLVASHRV
jgi:hypothetical protein